MGMRLFLVAEAFVLASQLSFCQVYASGLSATAAARLLDQATWGPTPDSIVELQQEGMTDWLNGQFSLKVSDLPDQPVLNSDGTANRDLRPVQAAFFRNALSNPDQLRQRVAFALSQIWVVSAVAGVPNAYAYPPYWRIFRDNAFTNYRDIIQAVTLNPAMGRYLNMANNNKANPVKGTAANENYARELLQLFTLGLTELNPDGSPVPNAPPMFDQDVVTQLAKAFTGWTYPTAPGAAPKVNNPPYYIGSMFAVESQHDASAKKIFGNVTIPAGQTARQDLNSVIDALMRQPTMAPFVSRQLIQHLVTSNPSPQYVARVAQVFENDGLGVAGDMKAVITAILMDPEARSGDAQVVAVNPTYGHLREPVLFVANLLRGLNATLSAGSAAYNLTSSLGEDLFNEPSVFSYFSPSYRTEGGLLGPEFQIYSTQTAAQRANIVNSAVYGALDKGTTLDLSPFVSRAADLNSLLDYISSIFLHGSMPSPLRNAAIAAAASAGTARAKTQAVLYIVLTSGDYQIVQ